VGGQHYDVAFAKLVQLVEQSAIFFASFHLRSVSAVRWSSGPGELETRWEYLLPKSGRGGTRFYTASAGLSWK
jgi:hypothetical protein